jgi:hypothetical protein
VAADTVECDVTKGASGLRHRVLGPRLLTLPNLLLPLRVRARPPRALPATHVPIARAPTHLSTTPYPAALAGIGVWKLFSFDASSALAVYILALSPFVGIVEMPAICACFRA